MLGKKTRKRFEKKLKVTVAPFFMSVIIRFLSFSLKITEHNPESVRQFWRNEKSVIVAFWHGRLLMVAPIFIRHRKRNAYALVSHHNDGEIITRCVRRLGYDTIRGSTSKGGFSALRKMIRALNDGSDLVIAPDGPRGPRGKAQRGVIDLARLSGAPIIPLAFSSSKKKVLKTWDAFIVPIPFSKGVYVWGDPFFVDHDANEEYFESQRLFLEEKITEVTNLADGFFDN